MNKAESAGVGLLAAGLIWGTTLAVFYFLVLDNFIIVMEHVRWIHGLWDVKDNIFWLWFGISLLIAIRGGTHIYHRARS
jgi:hypothetical protein